MSTTTAPKADEKPGLLDGESELNGLQLEWLAGGGRSAKGNCDRGSTGRRDYRRRRSDGGGATSTTREGECDAEGCGGERCVESQAFPAAGELECEPTPVEECEEEEKQSKQDWTAHGHARERRDARRRQWRHQCGTAGGDGNAEGNGSSCCQRNA